MSQEQVEELIKGLVTQQSKATRLADGIRVEATGKRPYLGTAAVKLNGPLTLRLRVRSEHGGTGEVKWRTADEAEFPRNGPSVEFAIQPSPQWQEVDVALPSRAPRPLFNCTCQRSRDRWICSRSNIKTLADTRRAGPSSLHQSSRVLRLMRRRFINGHRQLSPSCAESAHPVGTASDASGYRRARPAVLRSTVRPFQRLDDPSMKPISHKRFSSTDMHDD